MPYEILEKEIDSLTDVQKEAVFLFVRFLASQDGEEARHTAGHFGVSIIHEALNQNRIKNVERRLGGFEQNFYMAPDFDEPLAEFAEYM